MLPQQAALLLHAAHDVDCCMQHNLFHWFKKAQLSTRCLKLRSLLLCNQWYFILGKNMKGRIIGGRGNYLLVMSQLLILTFLRSYYQNLKTFEECVWIHRSHITFVLLLNGLLKLNTDLISYRISLRELHYISSLMGNMLFFTTSSLLLHATPLAAFPCLV